MNSIISFSTFKKITFTTLFLAVSPFSRSTTTYTVGSSGDNYSTIAAAYSACTGATDYVIELQSDYAYNTETTTGTVTISLGALANKSSVNTVTIRPASGVSLSFSGTVSTIFTITGANWLIIDGRAAGIGASALTIINSSSSASKRVFTFINDASNNTIKYCTIKGDNSSTSSGTAGLILFSTTTGTTGNDSNTITYCTLQENSAIPGCLIQSTGTAAKTNSGNTISNCNLVNAKSYSIWMDSNTDTWTVTGNSFYQTAAISPATNFFMININTGGAYTITGNYFGGQAASCSGSAFTITTIANQIGIIQFGSSCSGGNNTISSNTFSNMAFTTTYTAGTKVSIIIAQGSSSFIIGSSGNGNTIGATSGTGNITITDNSASGTRTLAAINLTSTGTSSSVAYNTIGALTVNGTNTTGTVTMVRNVGSGATLTITNNTFGNTTANNISITSNFINDWVTNSGGGGTYTLTVTNNTFQNFNVTSTADRDFWAVNNNVTACTLTATGNIIKNITATTVGLYYFIAHGGWISTLTAGATISSNTLQDITVSGTAATDYQFILFSNTSGTTTMNTNTIGSSTTNNMNFKANTYCYPIYKDGSGSFSGNSNTIQQFTIPNTGTSASFAGINIEAGTATIYLNTIRNITSTSQASFPITAIDINGTSGSHAIYQNKISGLSGTTTASVTSYIQGISIGSSVGSGEIYKNRITTLSSTKTGSTGNLAGIYNFGNTGAWNYYNNVIILSNGSNTNEINVIGIGHTSTGTSKIIHNTVYISGSTTSTASSYAMYDFPSSGTRTVFNNIFQNKRTGSGDNYAILNNNVGTFTYNYNYLEVSDDQNKVVWQQNGAGNRTFAQWQTTSGYSNNKSGSITVNTTTGVVTNATTSDVQTTGANDYYANVSDDFDGNFRANAGDGSPDGPWIGAFESIVALPIELVSFTATVNRNKVDLNWETSTEFNNDFFTIEKTLDGQHFETVSIVKGGGNSSSHISYFSEDLKPYSGISYYRLTQTDYDGDSKSYDLKSVNFNISVSDEISLYPNPINQNQQLTISLPDQESAEYYLIDIYTTSGILCHSETLYTENQNSKLFLTMNNNLMTGSYLVLISDSNSVKTSKILLIK